MTKGVKVMGEEQKPYRIKVDIRLKGTPYSEGIELKTEHYEDREEILKLIDQFIEDTFLFDDDEVFGGDDES